MPLNRTLCYFTVVMNRLHHVEKTLPANLRNNSSDSTCFLILDYNSQDGLQDYILENYQQELKRGKLAYHRYAHAKYFSHSHSRNMAVRLADTPFVCNLDADNFTGEGFDAYLLEQFALHPQVVISALSNEQQIYGAFGRMATRREHFAAVGGYDESFKGYGFEDYDLVHRLEQSGLRKIIINEPGYLQSLAHDNTERVSCEWTSHQLKVLYRQQVSDTVQVLLYLFKDSTMHYGVVNEDFSAGVHYRYSLAGDSWQKGTWIEGDETLQLHFERFSAHFDKSGVYLTGNNHRLKVENDPERLQEAVLFHTNMANCCLYQINKKNGIIRVNENGFGHGVTESLVFHH